MHVSDVESLRFGRKTFSLFARKAAVIFHDRRTLCEDDRVELPQSHESALSFYLKGLAA